MPNHCNNALTITGKSKDINKLMKQVRVLPEEEIMNEETGEITNVETIFSCQKVIPIKEDSNVNRVERWGSKWDIYDIEEFGEWEEGVWGITFCSAWSPIVPVIDKLAKQHKSLEIKYSYYEEGADFIGYRNYENGKCVAEFDTGISEASCEVLEEVMGVHHRCEECSDVVECCESDTPSLCEDCLEEQEKEENQELSLWEEETEQNA